MNRSISALTLLSGTVLASGFLAIGVAHADTAGARTDAPAAEQALPEDASAAGGIVVTARFRNEQLQNVPIAMSVVSGSSAQSRNLNTIQDIAATVPSLDFRNGASNKDRNIFIRGIGTITTSPGVESSVSTVLDGVVLVRPGQATFDLVDLERIEVLRGPQGTLFGKNASAGVVNIITKAPSDHQTGVIDVGYYEGNEERIRAGLSGPINDWLGYSISGLYGNYQGNVRNLGTNHWVNGYERWGGRGKLVAKPASNLTITLAGDYLHNKDTTPNGVYASTSQTAFGGATTNSAALAGLLAQEGVTASANNKTVNTNFDTYVKDDNYGGSLTAEWRPGDYTVTSITAYREWKNRQVPDWDQRSILASGFPQGADNGYVNFNQFSQELRLASPQGKLIDYVVGAYYLHANTNEIYQRTVTQLTSPTTTQTNTGVATYGTQADNLALFGEANLHAGEKLTFILGGRLIYDKLTYYHQRNADTATGVTGIRPSIAYSTGSTDRVDGSGRVGVQYRPVPQATLYATYSRGYKGPAYNVFFNMQAFDQIALKPETSNSYEVGLKGGTRGGAFTGSIAAYWTDFSGYQANYQDSFLGSPVTRLINAGTVRTRGIEIDAAAHPTDRLTLNWAAVYSNARIRHFNCPAATVCPNYDGAPLPFAPDWKLSGGGAWRLPLTDTLGVELQTDWTFRSATQFALTQTPSTIQPAYGIWNASVALIDKRNWEIRGVVKNLLNTHYSNLLSNGTTAGTLRFVPRDNDRYVGVNASYHF
ncbi:TonB-dependent receptor [Novosphingobium sp.]|uniref:TonB-dependent receptor n=1 Tax=Novosphingobium sp. TaxID=1874826 RepID=UPI0031D9CF31